MKPANLTVLQLFERQQRYVVPLFQRQYIWSQDRQWEPLWEDISIKAQEILSHNIGQRRELNNHFLGAIVLMAIKVQGLQVWAKSIIDGQQRLSTLQIILIALRDVATKIGYKDSLRTLKLHTENITKAESIIEKYKVWPTRADQKPFMDIFDSGSYDELCLKYPIYYEKGKKTPSPLPGLVEAYKYFYNEILNFVSKPLDNGDPWPEGIDPPSTNQKIDALIAAFKNNLEIVTIDLDESDNPQAIFETLNFRGEPLLSSDLIRNFIFLEADNQKLPINDLYDNYWYRFDKPEEDGGDGFWKQEKKVGRRTIQHLDLFIFHYLSFASENDILLTRTYQEFIEWWRKQDSSFVGELENLTYYAEIYKKFYLAGSNTRAGIFLNRISQLDITTIYPFLLYIFGERKDLTDNERIEWITFLESFIFRRLVCRLSPKNFNNQFRVITEKLRNIGDASVDDLNALLLANTKDSNRWPDDAEFAQSWLTQNAYNRRGASIVLEALEMQMHSRKQEKLRIDSKLSVEHVLPRGWSEKSYPFPDSMKDDPPEISKLERNSIIHTYGNLTLVTKPLNSSLSNSAFEKKRPEIASQSLLSMNAYFQDCGATWDEDQIKKRGKNLIEVAKEIWPYPEGHTTSVYREPPSAIAIGDDVEKLRWMLSRRVVSCGQKAVYEALYDAGDAGLSGEQLAKAVNRTPQQLAGVLGGMGTRINKTEGLEDGKGINHIFDLWEENGDLFYRLKPEFRAVLKDEGIVDK
jgi:uncharacterized protein with ParB-like and HNH nuclease domain